jgi:hypothetical protein
VPGSFVEGCVLEGVLLVSDDIVEDGFVVVDGVSGELLLALIPLLASDNYF